MHAQELLIRNKLFKKSLVCGFPIELEILFYWFLRTGSLVKIKSFSTILTYGCWAVIFANIFWLYITKTLTRSMHLYVFLASIRTIVSLAETSCSEGYNKTLCTWIVCLPDPSAFCQLLTVHASKSFVLFVLGAAFTKCSLAVLEPGSSSLLFLLFSFLPLELHHYFDSWS